MFSRTVRPASLAVVSRNWATMLDAGVPAIKATRMAGRKAADARLRRAMAGVADDVAAGGGLAESVKASRVFPELFVDLLDTAEQAGAVPEVLRALSDHYERMVKMQRDFRAQILPSVLQLTAAIFIIAALIYVLGIIAETGRGNKPLDVTGLGLSGASGALTFLLGMFGAIAAAVVGYKLVTNNVASSKLFHNVLLHVPVIGRCLRNFALARFSWAFSLTQNAGLPIKPSLESSMRATSNGAFIGHTDDLVQPVMNGQPLSDAMQSTGLFPPDYLEMVAVGENTGTVPETLERIGPDLEDNARRSLRSMASALGYGIWFLVASFIAFIVIRVAYLVLVAPLNEQLQQM